MSKSPRTPSAATPRRRAPPGSSDPVSRYARDVVAGRIVAGPGVRAACARHLRDIAHAHERGLHFSREKSQRALDFFSEVLRLNGGEFEGMPFVLQPWQAFIVGSLFGWLREDGMRRFRTAYLEIAKGSGKSPLAAGIGLYCLCSDDEPRAEVYSAASKKDQAMILFRDAVAMVDQSPDLATRLVKTGGQQCYNLGYPANGSFFRAISSEDHSQSGPRPHCTLIDEVHEHPNANVITMLAAGQKGRRQPLQVEITNSGFDRQSICFEHHEYSGRVCDGTQDDDQWFAYVCGIDDGDDPLDPDRGEACWIKANPNLGVSIQREYLQKQVREARGMPSLASKVRRLNFCEWVDAESPWISGSVWLSGQREFDAVDVLAGADDVVGAFDLSGTSDLTALALAGRVEGRIVARVEFWTPGDTAEERSKRDKVPYPTWIRQGFLQATPGRAVDYGFVAQRIAELQTRMPLRRAAFDPYRIKYLEKDLDEAGVELQLIEHPQGYYKPAEKKDDAGEPLPVLWMPRSIELLQKCLFDEAIDVEWNPVLNFNSASAVLEPDPKNNLIFTKRKSRGRIDGVVALAMCVGLLLEDATADAAGDLQVFFV